jgi:nitrite reductase/ring-hydroxylating ferredoxin subunit
VTNTLKLSDVGADLEAGDILCSIEDIEGGSAKELSFRAGTNIYDIFIQRQGNDVFAYVNCCPHTGMPLNMEQGQFMEKSGRYLMCHSHGALFQLSDGLCVAGPCNGASLQSVDIQIENGKIIAL